VENNRQNTNSNNSDNIDDSNEEESRVISGDEDSEDEVEEQDIKVTVSLQNESVDPNPMPAPRKRNYNNAILSVMDMKLKYVETKRFALSFAKFFHLDPFEVTENDIVLSNKRTLSNITNTDRPKDLKLEIIKKEDDKIILTQCQPSAWLFDNIIAKSPYESTLKRRNYIEMGDYFSALLNTDWAMNKQSKYVTAQLLAGCIVINPANHQAIVVSTIEVYGRTRTIDIHRERFGLIKGEPMSTSLPPEHNHYKNIIVKIKGHIEGSKLSIVTYTLNALVTSSIRIDKQVDPCIGAIINSFDLSNSQGESASIFLDQKSVDKAMKFLNSDVNALEP
jgi:hypothetical protein